MLLRRSSAPFHECDHKLKGGSFKGRSFVVVTNGKWPYRACTQCSALYLLHDGMG